MGRIELTAEPAPGPANFCQVDSNGDGVIDAGEMRTLMTSVMGCQPTAEQVSTPDSFVPSPPLGELETYQKPPTGVEARDNDGHFPRWQAAGTWFLTTNLSLTLVPTRTRA